MNKIGVIFTLMLTMTLAFIGVVVWSVASAGRASPDPPRSVSMAESAEAMQEAVNAMAAHGEVMLTEGARTGNQDLLIHSQHWMADAQSLMSSAQMMGVNLTAPSSLHASPSDLGSQGNWGELNRSYQAMLHNPSMARTIDIERLRWTGLSMESEGSKMVEHGNRMVEDVKTVMQNHGLTAQAKDDLYTSAEMMRTLGSHLARNGEFMISYADRMRRMVGR